MGMKRPGEQAVSAIVDTQLSESQEDKEETLLLGTRKLTGAVPCSSQANSVDSDDLGWHPALH